MPVPRLASRCLLPLVGGAFALSFADCSTDGSADVTVIRDTLIQVDPEEFLGSVPCSDAPGAMRAYVATLLDVTRDLGTDAEPIAEFPLPSSPLVPCDKPVAFKFVAPGHRYAAQIHGYDRTDLRPIAPGSPILLDAEDNVVEPRWVTSCGHAAAPADAGADPGDEAGPDAGSDAAPELEAGAGIDARGAVEPAAEVDLGSLPGTLAVSRLTRHVRGCAPLEDRGVPAETAIRVELAPALGALGCGSEPGQVARFRAVLDGDDRSAEAACGQAVVFSGVTPGALLELSIDAFEANATAPRWGTRCWGSVPAGVTLGASCDPLSETGALGIDVAALLASRGLGCQELVSLRAVLSPERELVRRPPDCSSALIFGELLPGHYGVTITITSSTGEAVVDCAAVVAAGRTTFAACAAP